MDSTADVVAGNHRSSKAASWASATRRLDRKERTRTLSELISSPEYLDV